MKKAALHNLGCKVNAYETEAMRQLLEEAGYEIVPFAPGADVYVVNTCTVTNIADRKSRQMLHRAKKMNPEAIVVAAGCYVQTARPAGRDGKLRGAAGDGSMQGNGADGSDASIDIVLGNNCKKNIVEALREFEAAHAAGSFISGAHAGGSPDDGSKMDPGQESGTAGASNADSGKGETICSDGVWTQKVDISHVKEFEPLSLSKTQEHTRAYMKVQDGCNQFCTYCIIPYARGRVRSRAPEDVVREARTLAANGCRELVLTGIHLSSYGCDRDTTLLALIRAVHEVDGIERIRLGSLEPGIITEEFAETLAALPKFCPHFHLSLQSGCDATLRRMNRRYTAAEYEEKCALLRRVFRDPALTTDVIVGFPGETQEEFEETVAFLKRIRLYETHIFKYSRRQGTRAAQMPDQIPESVKGERSERLIALGEENRRAFEALYAGREVDVLFEEKCTAAGREYYSGYTKEYIRAAVPADQNYENVLRRGVLGEELEPHLYRFS